ncbi:MAG TPA: hypothetical protein VHC93_20385 [Methylomirabilota bacterium]|jgi:hypothetical protein|nr:hypothetical protein [Methylomirabilota bacterium]
MTRRIPTLALLVALLVVLAALTPLAYATPPDPVWVSGFFDDDDNDDGVFLVTSSLAAIDPFPLCRWTPFPAFGSAVALDDSRWPLSQIASSADARAPPSS